MPLPVANGSLSLQGTSRPGDALQTAPKRAMIVRMTEETLKALEAHPNHPSLEFEFGDTPAIHIGSAVFPMHVDHESIAHELYLRSAPANKPHAPLKLYAAITGKVLVDRELDTSISDRVRESTVQAAKAKNGKRIVVLDAPPAPTPSSTAKAKAPPKKRKVLNSGAPVVTKRVNVPIQAKNEGSAAPRGPSPLPPQDAVPELPPSVRNRMVHCLATGQRTADDVIRLVGGANPEAGMPEALRQLLDKVAIPNPPAKRGAPSPTPPKYQLRTTSWLDVRPYEWPRLTEGERTTLARQARIAYADLKIPESDPRWDHVRYRAPAGTAAATSTPTSTAKPDPPKRKLAPPKASAASAKGKHAPLEDNFLRVPSSSSARSSEREREASPDKRRPGSGFKNASGSGSGSGSSSRDSPAAPAPPPTQQQRRQALVESRMKLVPTPAREDRERETPPASRERPKEKAKERERDKPVPKKKAKDELRETPSGTGAVKRKKAAQGQRDEIDEELARVVGSAPAGGSVKRRKMEDGTPVPAPPKKARERESDRDDRGRDRDRDRDAPPRKVKREREPSPPPPRTVKREREPSPPPERKVKRERDASSPPQRTVKRERDASPPPPRKIKREREREPSPAPASKPKRRRSSPIYTSSEDDAPAPKPASAPGPLPKGRAALRARYRASYAEYMGAFSAMYAERNRIQAALADGAEGEEGGVMSEGEGGVMSEGEVTRLVGRFEVLGADLERIRRAWEEGE